MLNTSLLVKTPRENADMSDYRCVAEGHTSDHHTLLLISFASSEDCQLTHASSVMVSYHTTVGGESSQDDLGDFKTALTESDWYQLRPSHRLRVAYHTPSFHLVVRSS